MNKFDGMIFLEINNAAFLPEKLKQVDISLFHKINSDWSNGFLDTVLPYFREPFVWFPFYFFLALFVIINFRIRGALWVLSLALMAMITDYTSSSIIKGMFFRLRPCRDPMVAHHMNFIANYCPISSSFVSSHAVNHFAIATFVYITFKNALSPKWAFIFVWAFIICYAQVYVGVHFPFDVFCGAIVGIILGFIASWLFNRFAGLPDYFKT